MSSASPSASAAALSASSSEAARFFHLPGRTPSLSLFSKSRPLSLSLSTLSLSPLHPPPVIVARRGRPVAASVTEEAPPLAEVEGVPEPVESQLAASSPEGPGKGDDVFAVVMIGSRQYIVFPGRFLYTQRLKGANVNDKVRSFCDNFCDECCHL